MRTPTPRYPTDASARLGIDPDSLQPLAGGYSNETFRGRLEDIDVVVKRARHPLKRRDLAREAWTLASYGTALGAQGVPVPVLVAHDTGGDGQAVIVVSLLEGDLGLQVAAQTDRGGRATLVAAMVDTHRRLRAAGTAPLVHGDFGLHNTLWARDTAMPGGWRLTALLDWEFARPGEVLIDAAWFAWTLRLRFPIDELDDVVDVVRSELGVDPDGHAARQFVRAPQMMRLYLRTPPGSAVRELWHDRLTALG